MIARCHNEASPGFRDYGAKGIAVCARWRFGEGDMSGFECFHADMGDRPGPAWSLDRYPDQRGGYRPGNVRWATKVEQMRNMTTNRLITHNGLTLTVAEWAERTGIRSKLIDARINRLGWPTELLFSPPDRSRKKRKANR